MLIFSAYDFLCEAKKSRDACYYACNFVAQTYVQDPGVTETSLVKKTIAQNESITKEAFDIKEISGSVIGEDLQLYGQMALFHEQDELRKKYVHVSQSIFSEEEQEIYAAYLRIGIRTLDMELSGYAVFNLRKTNFDLIWRTLYTISHDECEGIPTREIVALRHCDQYVNKNKTLEKRDEIYICKGIMILMYYISGQYESVLGHSEMDPYFLINWRKKDFVDIRKCELPGNTVPEWVYDVHTLKGKRAGHTDFEMNLVEQAALNPLQKAFFDDGNWKPRYEYKNKHGLCTPKEYLDMLEYSKTREGNPVKKIKDRF